MIGGYVRISKEKESADTTKSALQDHENRIRKYVKDNFPGEDLQIYSEVESAVKMHRRTKLNDLINDVYNGIIDKIVFVDYDRMFRDIVESQLFRRKMHDMHIRLFDVSAGEIKDDRAEDAMSWDIKEAFARFEWKKTSDRQRLKYLDKAKTGRRSGGIYPYGYDTGMIINRKEAKAVKLIFNTFNRTGSYEKTAHTINLAGYRTKAYALKKRGNKPWDIDTIKTVLTNYVYIGKMEVYRKKRGKRGKSIHAKKHHEIVQASWEPIISEEVFKKAQDLMEKNRSKFGNFLQKGKYNEYIFSGTLVCTCGRNLNGFVINKKTKNGVVPYYYYQCKQCHKSIPLVETEERILTNTIDVLNNKEMLSSILKEQKQQIADEELKINNKMKKLKADVDKIESKIKEKEAYKATLYTALANTNNPDIIADINKSIQNTLAEIAEIKRSGRMDYIVLQHYMELKNDLEMKKWDIVPVAQIDLETFNKLSPGEKKDIIEQVYKEIKVDVKTKEITILFRNATKKVLPVEYQQVREHGWQYIYLKTIIGDTVQHSVVVT